MKQIISLWHHLSKLRQRQLYMLLALMFIASIAEVISIGLTLPFLGVFTSPEQIYQHSLMQYPIQLLNITKPDQLILPLTIAFITVAIFAGIIRLTLLYVTTRLSYAIGADISIDVYRRTLHQEYSVHLLKNSSEVINGIVTKTHVVVKGGLTPALILVSSIIMLVGIVSVLFVINMQISFFAVVGFGVLYGIVIKFTRKKLKQNSSIVAYQSNAIVKSLQEGLGGIRDVLIDGSQEFYCTLYRNADLPMRRASGDNMFISGSPKFVMESIGMSLIAILAYFLTQNQGGITTAIPILGALALGAQRLIPALQQAYSSYSAIQGSRSSNQDVLDLLNQPLPIHATQNRSIEIPFKKEIILNNISFRYSKNTPWVLKNINLKITKGMRVGFIGTTGSGKSTLLDVIMGLTQPTKGEVVVDNKVITVINRQAWRRHIAHVPQSIYLSDNSIEENVAFGIPKDEINKKRVEKSIKQAKIDELIGESKDGYQAIVGEQGIRLSGGQRQRIGIARALYKQTDILVFDEATSALDNNTERAVMKEVSELKRDLTVLIIAHRLSTLKNCDRIIRINNNGSVDVGTYDEMINS
ncbi:ABC transporter ATP-binding protein [Candidatus Thioglobus autotrophicus]|uniref:ABC transporter ATP-binding protein n=2 Tax=Candidatus Thioglobus autotrophicus TaxID=1705394 RepID=A0A0M4P8B4_9GAMM|nr:ABC transporter ATP-binding protein [Candidatus Thioglobus autotrophicus]